VTGDTAGTREMVARARAIHSAHEQLGEHLTAPLRRLETALAGG
jgi:hypothetical protein